MAEIDERIVSMKFDNRQFENGVSTSISTIDKLKKALDFSKQEKTFDQLEKTANSISFSGLQNSLANIEKWVSPVGNHIVQVFDRAMNYVESKVKNTWDAIFKEAPTDGFKEYELKMGSVQTIMASTGESIETVNGYLDELNAYADRTIYSFSDMTSNIGKFTNAGVKLDDAVKAIQGVSNVAAVSGANAQQASHAMYNFAQALSSGSVKLVDWKSIATASMDTQEFKQELINSAVELGTLIKEGEKFVSTTTDMNGHVSELFDSTHAFNESLSSQWMTTDVLIKTLKKYTDETTDLGKKAFKAATEVKTFTQLLDTLKEGMGSGWSESFQLIIGDFEEAKQVWSTFYEILGGIIDRTATVRNNLLKMWRDSGGRDRLFESFKTGLEELDRIHEMSLKTIFGDKYNKLIEKNAENLEGVSDALKDVTDAEIEAAKHIWYGPNTYGTGAIRKSKLEEEFGEDGARRVQKLLDDFYTKGQDFVKVEKEIDETTEDINQDFEDFQRTKFGKTLQNLIDTAKNLGTAFMNLMEVGKRLFKIFSTSVRETLGFDVMSEDVESFSGWIAKLTEKLLDFVKQQKNIYKIRDAFDFLMKTINKLWDISVAFLKGVWRFLEKIVDKYKELMKRIETSDRAQRMFNAFKKIFENLKDWVVKTKDAFLEFIDNFKETENGQKLISNLEHFRDILKELAQKGLDWVIEKLEELGEKGFDVPNFEEISEWLTSLPAFAEHIGEKFGLAKNKIFEFFSSLDDENATPAQRLFGDLLKLIGDLFSEDSRKRVAERVSDLWSGILDGISSVKLSDILGAANLFFFIRLVNAITSTLKGFKKQTKSFKKSVIGVIDGLGSIEGAIVQSIKAEAFEKFATAVAIIAGSMIALTLVDQQKLSSAAAVIIIVMITLSMVIEKFENIINRAIDGIRLDTVSSLFFVLSGVALGIISFAILLKTAYEVFMGIYALYDDGMPLFTLIKMMATFGALIAVIGTLVVAVGLLSIASKNIKKESALAIVAVAAAVYIAVKAFEVLAKTVDGIKNFDEVMISLIALMGSLTLLTAFSKYAGSMAGVGGGLILFAIGLAALVPPLTAFMYLIDHYGSTFSIALGSMGAILFVMTALAAALSKFTMGVVSFNVMAGALIKIAAAMLILGLAIAPLSKQLKPLGLIFAGMLVLGLASTEMAVPLMLFAKGLLGVAASIAIVAVAFGIFVGAIWLLGEALPNLANGFMNMVAVLNDGRPQIMAALGTMIQGIAYTLIEAIPYIVTFVGKLILGIIQGLRDGIKDLLLVIVDILDSIVMFLMDIMDPLVDRIIKVIAEFFYSLAISIESNSAYLGAAVTRFIEALVDIVVNAIRTVFIDAFRKFGLDDLADYMVEEMNEKVEERTSQWKVDREKFRETAAKNGAIMAEATNEGLAEGIAGTSNTSDIYAGLYGGTKAIQEAAKSNEKLSETFATNTTLAFGDNFDISGLIKDNLAAGNVSMFNGFEDMTSMCQQYGIDIPTNLQNEEGFADAMAANNKSWNKEFESNFPQTKEEGKKMSEEGATGAGTQNWRYARAAQNVCDTFAATLYKNRQLIFERGQAIAKAAADGLEGKLEIASPSKLMARDGLYTILGFVQGLDSNKRLIENASGDLGDAVVASFTSPLDHIAAILRGEEEYDPTIRPVLDLTNVREGASEINGLFANRSVELASINGRLNANNLAMQRLADQRNADGSKDVVAAIGLMRGDINALNETMANTELVMDSGAVVGAIKRPMDNALGRMNMLKGRRN